MKFISSSQSGTRKALSKIAKQTKGDYEDAIKISSLFNSLMYKEVTINLKMQRTIYLALRDLINMEEE